VLDASAALVDRLLRSRRELKVLITSRQPLGISGEAIWRVPPLSLPPNQLEGSDEIAASEAVRLFVDRARSALATFALTHRNVHAVAQTCRRLDGMPLALELAAARVAVLTPDEILHRLDDRFQLLTGGSRTAALRQQTLRATLDWSYELLDPSNECSCAGSQCSPEIGVSKQPST
jgi:predicted ATPase